MKKSFALFLILISITMVFLSACTSQAEDDVWLVDWAGGRVKLAPNAVVVSSDNVSFFVSGREVRLEKIPVNDWVYFRRTDPNFIGIFTIKTDRSGAKWAEKSSHIQLAKPGKEPCQFDWAKTLFGDSCQTEVLSVH